MLHQKHESYKYLLPLKNWVDSVTNKQEKNVTISKNYILRKSALKLKKTLFFPLMATFYNFALEKIEANCPKKVLKSILETLNAHDVILYVWFIHSGIKKI